MTEDEAKQKWCPFARGREHQTPNDDNGNTGGANRFDMGDPDSGCLCIGSQCMAWRWLDFNHHGKGVNRGYCGAAGKP